MSTTLEKPMPIEEGMVLQDGDALLRILDERFERAKREGVFYTVDEVFDRIEKKLQERE